MKKINFIYIVLLFVLANVSFAAIPFPGKENQEVISNNGITCVPEHTAHWKEGYPCCEGLIPYLPLEYAGQPSCTPYEEVPIVYHPTFWSLLGFILIAVIVFLIKKKNSK